MTELVFYYRNTAPCPAFKVLAATIQASSRHQIISCFNEFLIDVYVLADSPSSRRVAIDFDNTITADPDFYIQLIKAFRQLDWEPLVCSLRSGSALNLAEIREKLQDDPIHIYTTDGQHKRDYLLQQGIQIGLWIDDYFPAVACPGAWILQVNGITY